MTVDPDCLPGARAPRLLIDLGNTRLKWVLASGREFTAPPGAMPFDLGRLPWDVWCSAAPAEVVIASVAPDPARDALLDALATWLRVPVRSARVEAEWQGLWCAYRNPEKLGIDRWLAVIAAHDADPASAALLVSAGTALTVDRLDPGGRHRGGVIAPGLAAMRAGLVAAAPGLAVHGPGEAGGSMATNSADAIASGCLQAALGLIRHAVQDMLDEGLSPSVWLSGGDAPLLAPHLAYDLRLRPALVLEGLAIWAYRSAKTPSPDVD
ncbi:type III pantothenate kinase [Pseudofulvimonas gallinarii]|jgi:type III pantothenate kinase|uniref:Type III pantothenate kinase n=1 Tax=Pseudofulvimonas gallinarii TaxID=634155 RepID=A0A4R3LLA5_9GAMM|nr:type III pantothenate kinase [Pseudofulvimonas gallinarii]TCT00309.1 type III pantothenate kinase [Pseudofulvimonas gallinarii]THD14150.1 hypothetical protein B1808_04745 [Pseudofulvimonas gallinarii]